MRCKRHIGAQVAQMLVMQVGGMCQDRTHINFRDDVCIEDVLLESFGVARRKAVGYRRTDRQLERLGRYPARRGCVAEANKRPSRLRKADRGNLHSS